MENKDKDAVYTKIYHKARKRMGLSLMDYCVADTIYCLSQKYDWCFASKRQLADKLGVSERTIFSSLNRLENEGVIERKEGTMSVRTRDLWEENIEEAKSEISSNKSRKAFGG